MPVRSRQPAVLRFKAERFVGVGLHLRRDMQGARRSCRSPFGSNQRRSNGLLVETFARRIVGWRTSRRAHACFVLDMLEQALHDRCPVQDGGLVHHSGRGRQYVSIKYTPQFNNRRLLKPIRNIPPTETQERYNAVLGDPAMATQLNPNGLWEIRDGS